MSQVLIEQLRAMCGGARDGALLRVSLANALLAAANVTDALVQLREALRFDPDYSAAWKQLGKVLADQGETGEAIAAFTQGIAAAIRRGDKQTEKEMSVFLRRLQKRGE